MSGARLRADISSTAEALRALGVTGDEITAAQRTQIDRDGYCMFEFDEADWRRWGIDLDVVREQVDVLHEREGWKGGLEGKYDFLQSGRPLETGAARLGNLTEKHPIFRRLVLAPPVLAACASIVPEMKLSSLNYRDPAPGTGGQRLHVDWIARQLESEPFGGCICFLYLDDMDLDNGPTRIVPGTHKRLNWPDAHIDVGAVQPNEVKITAKAGWMVAANLHLWHGGTDNVSGRRRRVMNTTYRHRGVPQFLNPRKFLSAETLASLSPAERYLYAVRESDPVQLEDNVGPGNTYREWLRSRGIHVPPIAPGETPRDY
jgi:hypothetical protein